MISALVTTGLLVTLSLSLLTTNAQGQNPGNLSNILKNATNPQGQNPGNLSNILKNATVVYPGPYEDNEATVTFGPTSTTITNTTSTGNLSGQCYGPRGPPPQQCPIPNFNIVLRSSQGEVHSGDQVRFSQLPLRFTLSVSAPGSLFTEGDCEIKKNGLVIQGFRCVHGQTYQVPLRFDGSGFPTGTYEVNSKQYACYRQFELCERWSDYAFTGIRFNIVFG